MTSAVFALLMWVAAQAQPPPTALSKMSWLERLRTWVSAVKTHAPGANDAAARQAGSWSAADLNALSPNLGSFLHVLTLRQRPPIGRDGRSYSVADYQWMMTLAEDATDGTDTNTFLKRAAMLHTDASVLDLVPPVAGMTAGRLSDAVRLQVSDGKQVGWAPPAQHWAIARHAVSWVMPRDEWVRDWYLAAGSYLHRKRMFGDLEEHLATARKLYPSDPGVLFQSGVLHETFASPPVQTAIAGTLVPVAVRDAESELLAAESMLRAALFNRTNFAACRLRLGHVLLMQGDAREAEIELQQAIGTTTDQLLLYYAHLFLGRVEQLLDKREDARAEFERARDIYPRAQSPRLSLAALAINAGEAAAASIEYHQLSLVTGSEEQREDPWWWYGIAHTGTVEEDLARLRRQIMK